MQRRQLTTLALILGLHGVLFVVLTQPERRAPDGAGVVQRPMNLRLLDLRLWPQPATPPSAAPQPARPARPLARRLPEAASESVAASATRFAAPGADAAAAAAAAAMPPPSTDSAAVPAVVAPQAGLNLSLPRSAAAPWRQRNPAVDAQIGGRAPDTVESRIAAAAANTGPWVQERIGNDRILMRRGDTCFNLDRPRAAQLFPFDQSSQRLPWMASQPFRC